MKHVLFFLLIAVAAATQAQTIGNEKTANLDAGTAKNNYTVKIIPLANGGFGYDIYANNKLFIHQTTIPAMPGNKGFATKADAEKVARKVVEKMQEGETLPTITIDEMKRLGAIPKS